MIAANVRRFMMKEEKGLILNVSIKMKTARFFGMHNLHALAFIVTVCILGTSCTKEVKVITEFPATKKLESRHIAELDTLYTAYAVTKVGDKFAFTVKKKSKFLYVYNEDFTPYGSMLEKGNGHNEWFAPLITGQLTSVNGKPYACVLERSGHTLYAVNLNGQATERIKLADFKSKELTDISYAYKTGENDFIGANQGEQTELFTYNNSNGKTSVIQPQGIDPAIFAADKFGLSQTLSTYNDGLGKIAVAYFSFPLLCIMNGDGSGCITVQLGETLPKYDAESAADSHFYFSDICSTKDRVYVLYDDPENADQMSILGFDWEGNPVARYCVPRLTCFTVDESNKRFIAIQEDDTNGICFEMKYE